MKKICAFAMILLLVLMFTGCDDEESTTSPSAAFLGGEAGLKVNFLNDMPPDEILDKKSQPFGIGIKLENMGEANVEDEAGYIEISGLNAVDFGVEWNDLKKDIKDEIKGVRKTITGARVAGGVDIIEFTGLNYEQDIPGQITLPMIADICYNYKTRVATKICVKKDLLDDLEGDRICEVSGEKDVQNSGAPLHITKLSQAPLGKDKIQLLFTIGHVGDPEDSFFEKNKECSDLEGNVERYKIYFNFLTEINGKKAQCNLEADDDKSKGYITLYDKGERQVSCTLDISNAEKVFEKVIDVELEYRYMQSLRKELLIKDVN